MRTPSSKSSGRLANKRGYRTVRSRISMRLLTTLTSDISRLTNSNIGDTSDDESEVVAGICLLDRTIFVRPLTNIVLSIKTWAQQWTQVPVRPSYSDRTTSSERRPHDCPLRLPPVIPLIGTPQRERHQTPSPDLEGTQDEAQPGRVPGDDANVVPRRQRLISLAMIVISANVSALLPTRVDNVDTRNPCVIARGHLPQIRRAGRLNRPHDRYKKELPVLQQTWLRRSYFAPSTHIPHHATEHH